MKAENQQAIKNQIAYIVMIIRDFGDEYGLTPRQSINYLRHHKALDYLGDFYDVEHTLPTGDTIRTLAEISKQNGGFLS